MTGAISRVAVAVVAGILLPALPSAADSGFRCGKRVVSIGDWANDVVRRCGDPDFASQRREYRTVVVREGRILVERSVEIVIDEWEYDLGPNRFVRHLYFENSRLLDVATGDRGDES